MIKPTANSVDTTDWKMSPALSVAHDVAVVRKLSGELT